MPASSCQILVHIDPTPQALQRLAVARRLAQRLGASVAALYAVTPSYLDLPLAPVGAPEMAAALADYDRSRLVQARAGFESAMLTPGPAVTWRELDRSPVIGAFAEVALYADLLVLGQHQPADLPSAQVPADFAEAVMAISGKPAVLVPYAGLPATVGETVAIAWKPTREAAHAVAAALPMLAQAREVHVLSWGDAPEGDAAASESDLNAYLKQHGVLAPLQWHHEPDAPGEVGELLLSRAFDLNADLLVMGCYSHSRAREFVLGGVTRTLLRAMTVPVLMAH